jgi:hypothetical protein
MYDQYLRGNTFAVDGTIRLPKHKGFLFTGAAVGATFYLFNDAGNTISVGVTFAAGMNIFPVQVHSVVGMGTGLTGYRLN